MGTEGALQGVSVLLSGSIPDQPNAAERLLAEQILEDFLSQLARGIIVSGGSIVFGGHPTVTPLFHKLSERINPEGGKLHLFQLERYRDRAPLEVSDDKVFPNVRWIPLKGAEERHVAEELREMRREMVARSHAAVFVGGRTAKNVGDVPGIQMESDFFHEARPQGPAYLTGLLRGTALELIRKHEDNKTAEPNGLDGRRLPEVHHSPNALTVATLILADLRRFFTEHPLPS